MSTTPGTVTPRDTDPDITRPAPDRRPPASAWALLRPLVLRLHFYAGVLVAPFLTVAALTGIVYVFSPQLSDLVYSDELLVGPRYGARGRSTSRSPSRCSWRRRSACSA